MSGLPRIGRVVSPLPAHEAQKRGMNFSTQGETPSFGRALWRYVLFLIVLPILSSTIEMRPAQDVVQEVSRRNLLGRLGLRNINGSSFGDGGVTRAGN